MNGNYTWNMAAKTVLWAVLSGALFLVLAVSELFPTNRRLRHLRRERDRIQNGIEEQKVLLPFYTDLTLLERGAEDTTLVFPAPGKLPEAKVGDIPLIFSRLAAEYNLDVVSAAPQFDDAVADRDSLPVSIQFKGGFLDLRNFLLALGGVPYVRHIRNVAIDSASGGEEIEIEVLLAVE
jgi:hypothetical protein